MLAYDLQYAGVLNEILNFGTKTDDRTGVGTTELFDVNIRVGLNHEGKHELERKVPLLGLRKTYPRSMWTELFWMLRGSTNADELKERGIGIWDAHSTREFLDSRGLHDVPTGEIGRGYGTQFRDFGGVDQLKELIIGLVESPNSRRHFISLWNPADLNKSALPPCHVSYNFMVTGDVLNLKFFQRSNDFMLAGNANIVFASFFLTWLAHRTGFRVGAVSHSITNCHLYNNHLDVAFDLLKRPPISHNATFLLPDSGVRFTDRDSVERLLDYELELMWDVAAWECIADSLSYESHPPIPKEKLIIAV